MSYAFFLPVGILLPKFIKYTSIAISDYIRYKTDKYCETSAVDDCLSAKEFSGIYLAPMLGASLGVITGVSFVGMFSNSDYASKLIEEGTCSICLGALGYFSILENM